MIDEKDREKYYFSALVSWGIFFALIYSYFLYTTAANSGNRIFNSPDENANYIFTQLFAEKNSSVIPEPLNEKYGNILYPRSTRVNEGGGIVPGSFFGMIAIYGMLAKFFGEWIIVVLTPIISFFGALFFFKFLKEVFLKKIAFASGLLLFIFPGWWYYNSRSMFHNVLFVNCLIFFLYSLVRFLRKKSYYWLVSSFIFLGLAIFVRTSEIVWILPGLFIAIFFARRSIPKKMIASLAVLFFLAVLVVAYLNNKIFGNILTAGYSIASPNNSIIGYFLSIVFPFGFHPKRALINFIHYYPNIFWWYFFPALFGIFGMFRKFWRLTIEQKYYVVIFCILTLFLIVYYGSWTISDNLDPKKVTVGTSYIRYWLPIYVFSIPFVAYFFHKILSFIKVKKYIHIVVGVLAFAYVFLSFDLVWMRTEESLNFVQERVGEYYIKRDMVFDIVPDDAIIITERSDKIFFPKMKIISEPKKDIVLANIKKMLQDNLPIYYYTFLSDKDVYEYERRLDLYGIILKNKTKILGNEYLYKVENE